MEDCLFKNLQIGSIDNKQSFSEFSDSRNPQELNPLYQAYVEKKYSNFKLESEKKGFRIVAEKGRWTRLGVPVVHNSIVVILVGALIGSFFGFDGFVNISEGESTDYISLRNSNDTLSLGFEIRCDDFDVSFYDTGAPKEFRSSLVILENGQKVAEKDIIVNDPLRYEGINFFQSSYGAIPPKKFQISFTSTNSNQSVLHELSIGQSVELPDGAGRFAVQEYVRDYIFRGNRMGGAVLGVLDKPGNEPTEIALPLRFPTFDKMRKGDWVISVEGYDNAYYTGLQVTRDPGVRFVYAGFILLILGCWVAFFMSHQIIGAFAMPLAFLSMAYASLSPNISDRIQPLLPALKSNWLTVHVVTCFIGYAAFAIAFGLALMYLIKKDDDGHENTILSRVPHRRILDELSHQMVLFGFLFLSAGIISGAVWANSAWGRYWGWDPKETWSLITWFVYATLLHARFMRGWRGKRIAVFSMVGFAAVLITYFGVNYLPGLHSYGAG